MTAKYPKTGNVSKVYIHESFSQFTIINNSIFDDEMLDANAIGVLCYLMRYSNKNENYTYKSVLSDRFSTRKVDSAWHKCERAGYIMSFRKYSSNGNEYQYHFDQLKFQDIDLLSLFEELYKEGFVYYSKILYKKENRTLLNIRNSLPDFLDDTKRAELAQWIFDRILFAQAPQAKEEAERVQKAYQCADEAITMPDIEETDNNQDKLRKQKNIIQQDYPEYKPLFARIQKVTKSIDLEQFELNQAVIGCVDNLKDYLLFTNPATKYGVIEEPLVYDIINRQLELNATQLKNINKYQDYFIAGIENLTKLKIMELETEEIAEALPEDYFTSIDSLRKAWGYN